MTLDLKVPHILNDLVYAHEKWLEILQQAEAFAEEDLDVQAACKAGKTLKGRSWAPEIVGRFYAAYCTLINQMYDAYLNSVHLQRSPYILEIVNLLVKRMYELRQELINLIVSEYFNIDNALVTQKLTPFDIQIVIPYHFPLECRAEKAENVLQKMWADAIKRKRPKKVKPPPPPQDDDDSMQFHRRGNAEIPTGQDQDEEDDYEPTPEPSVIDEGPIHATAIQKMERFRQWYMLDFKNKCNIRRTYFMGNVVDPPFALKFKAACLIQTVYREVIKIKREHIRDYKRDVVLGMLPESRIGKLSFKEENNKMYDKRRKMRYKLNQTYLRQLESEKIRLLYLKWEGQVDDITDHIREWFKEWFYGYGFLPEYPFEVEGGTILVINGQFPTVQEKIEADLKEAENKKGPVDKKAEKANRKLEAKKLAAEERQRQKKEAEQLFKLRCNPVEDPGYTAESSEQTQKIIDALTAYRGAWSLYDNVSKTNAGAEIYGYMKPLLIEDILCQMHADCRIYVDEFMRLELKLLINAHKKLYSSIGMPFPKIKPRKKPKVPTVPKPFEFTPEIQANLEPLFDLNLITRPKTKLSDVHGEPNFANYEYTLLDPNATFLLPAYGDVKDRLMMSCILKSGIQPGAPRRKAAMLVGPPRNGKSFLVDAVAGELNAVKIDISPEVFTAVVEDPGALMQAIITAARAFQPSVIFLKDIERAYIKAPPPEQLYLRANRIVSLLPKLVKLISDNDKIIFIATCSYPLLVKAPKPMTSLFEEFILIPTPDHGSIVKFFYDSLQTVVSLKPNFPYNVLGRILRGYAFGVIVEAYNTVLCPARRVSINITPLHPVEFLNAAFLLGEPFEKEEMDEYEQFCLVNSSVYGKRIEYAEINRRREDYFTKMSKKNAEKE